MTMYSKRIKGTGYFIGFALAALSFYLQPDMGVVNILKGMGLPVKFWIISFLGCGILNLLIGYHTYYKFSIFLYIPWGCYTISTIYSAVMGEVPFISAVAYTLLFHNMLFDAGVYITLRQLIIGEYYE